MAYNSDDILSYSALQHMRKKSSMYGFQTGSIEGPLLMCKEIVDNSIDEASNPDADPNKVYPINITFFVSKDKSTYQCVIQDYGRGVPCEKIIDVFTKEFTSGKYDEVSGYGSSIGTNGIGSKVVAALSSNFKAFTKRMDGFGYLSVKKGEVKDKLITRKSVDRNPETVGTTVMFQPDSELMTATNQFFGKSPDGTERLGFLTHVERMEFYTLFTHNIKINIRVVDGMLKEGSFGDTPQDMWKFLSNVDNFGGKLEFESDLNITPRSYVIKKFSLKDPVWDLGGTISKVYDPKSDGDRLGYNIDVFLDDKSLRGENGLIGAVNATPISDQNSTHFTMLQTVLKSYLEDYVIDEDKKNYLELKYQIPISGCVSVNWKGAGFDGQDKSKFTDNVFGDFYRSNLRRQLNKLPESIWERLYELIAENFEMAYAKYSKSQYKMNKNLVGIGYMLKRTGSYIPCDSKDPNEIELIITEGDSAAGRVKTVRDERFQALFKLSGKPVNAVRADTKKLAKNLIYQDLMELIGVRPTDTDLSNMRFKHIVILADADPDGYHIVSLLIGIIKEINERILNDGRIKLANPPLYSYKVIGDPRPLYLRDPSALREAKSVIYRCMLDVYIKIGKKPEMLLEPKAYAGLCAIVEDVGDKVTFVANQLNIDAFVLEQLMYCFDYLDDKKPNAKEILNILKDSGVDNVIWDKDSNSIVLVVKGFEELIPLSHLKELIEKQLLPMYEKYCWRNFNMFVTTKHSDLFVHQPCSFMMLYKIFKNITGDENNKHFAITRFKGLGEMSEKDILGTCVDPVHRCTYTITGIGDVNVIYSMLGADSEARKQLSANSVRGRLIDNGFIEED